MQPLHHPRENPTLALERDLQLLEHLDMLGYDEAWIGEHHSTGWENLSAPDIFIAAAAARTRSIRLGTGVIQLAIHHPFHVADRMVLLDHLTRGRAMLRVGVGGGLPSDLHVFGVDPGQAGSRFQQSLEVIMQLLTTLTPMTIKTDWFEMRDAILTLRPYSRPLFPLGIASDQPSSLAAVGRYGATLLSGAKPEQVPLLFEQIEQGAVTAGRTADRSQIMLTASMHLAETTQQARDAIRRRAAEEQWEFAVGVNRHTEPSLSRDAWVDQLADQQLIGTPDEVVQKIRHMQTISGGFGGLLIRGKEWATREEMWHSYELFARYVMPQFDGSLAAIPIAATVAAEYNQQRKHDKG